MMVLFIIIVTILVLMIVNENRKVLLMGAELSYIAGKLDEIIMKDECEYILLSTEHKEIQSVTIVINRLLEQFFCEQIKHKKSEESLMRMITNISHDFRTPLTVLKGYTEILQEKAKTAEIPREMNHIIIKLFQKTQESVRMVTQFFEMAKLNSGDTIFNIQQINICSLCGEVIMEYFDLLTEQGYRVDISMPKSPIYIETDKNACIRILKNLIDNAIKYGGKGDFLGLKIQDIGENVTVCLEDHGPGIDEREKELIFNRRYMQEKNGKQSFQSSGLGLSISKDLAMHIDAEIQVDSEAWKKTIFTIKFKKLEKS